MAQRAKKKDRRQRRLPLGPAGNTQATGFGRKDRVKEKHQGFLSREIHKMQENLVCSCICPTFFGKMPKKVGQTARPPAPDEEEERIVWHCENGYSNVSSSHTAPIAAAPARAHTAPGRRRCRGR